MKINLKKYIPADFSGGILGYLFRLGVPYSYNTKAIEFAEIFYFI